MNAAQIHLALNHAPLFLSLIGGGILLLGMIKKNESFKNLSLYFLIAAAVFTIPVFLTGEGTEELVENLPGVNENAIEEHEEMAKISLIIISIMGGLALIGLFIRNKASMARILFSGLVLLSLGSFVTMAQTAHLGGLIRHSEILNGTTANEGKEENEEDEMKGENKEAEKPGKDSLRQVELNGKKDKDDDD
ncbi:MAG: hypothetical protein JNJ86_10720 [Chitinophagaceae bacterium]|jgi:uncharacterized membrane protein|nr:hypothetical protein [Chitinophagaceae bacterium]